jgi:hypothetical protein
MVITTAVDPKEVAITALLTTWSTQPADQITVKITHITRRDATPWARSVPYGSGLG